MKPTNNYETIINAWKSIISFYNRNSDGKYVLNMPPAMFTMCELSCLLDNDYQPSEISYCDALNTFELHYDFYNITIDIAIGASDLYFDSARESVTLNITTKSTGFNVVFASCRLPLLKRIFDELKKIDLWERGPDLNEAILNLCNSVEE